MLEKGARLTKELTQPFERDNAANEAGRRSSLPTTPRHIGVFTRPRVLLGVIMIIPHLTFYSYSGHQPDSSEAS
jgi:hypothetical protein